ncbi:MAG: Helicase associated domain protein [Pseudomonadota bacterium]
MITHETKLLQLTKEKDCKGTKLILESLDYQVKGGIFEWYLAELYRGNGWLTNIQGGKQDLGADILLYHPKTPSKAAMVIQAKNHFKPLTFDQTKIELIKFEQKAARQYGCQQFQLVAVNGFVAEASKLEEFNLILSGWNHVIDLIEHYDPDTKTEPEIELYAHNKNTYENVNRLWQEGNYVAVVQATGTGKSMLIAKVMSDFLGQKTLVLAPSHYILDQQKAKVPWATQTTNFMTYAKISHLTQRQIENLGVELIVLDEFHRCGAEVWGAGVQRVLNAYDDSYVIGTTATPIRYLDDRRDMSDELFEGVVAADISLAEAIIKRILPAPTYVAALYTLGEEIEELRGKLFKSNLSEEKKKKIEGEVSQVAINWESTWGVPHILAKHLRPDINKLIVFCKDQNHLDKMEVEVQKWFQKAAIHRWRKVYRVISADPESDRNLEDFKNNHSKDTVHLLFAIDMLNEGLHLPDVGAVILLRPTESPIVFYQQIGRCIQVGADQAPIIFDFVNNFRSIRAGDFLQDLENAKKLENEKRTDLGLEEYAPNLQIIDETKEIIDVFDEIEDRLASWESMYEKLLEFKKKNGHCNVPDRWPEDLQLGKWVGKQRTKRNSGLLSTERIVRLNKIGFIWDLLASNWEEMFEYLLEFKQKNGHCNVPSRWPENSKLSRWVSTQREFWKNGKLSENRINRLEEAGFEWNILETNWNELFTALLKFKEKIGHCNVPRDWPENPDLSYWVSTQRENYRKRLLSPDRIERLEQIGFVWDTIRHSWEENYSALIEFKSATGHCDVPDKWPVNLKLSHWVGKQRSDRKKNRLSADRIERLNAIGFTWDPQDAVWNKMYGALQEYNKKNGHCNVPRNWSENIRLSSWVAHIRKLWKEGKLSRERIKQLELLGFTIIDHDAVKKETWGKMFSSLHEFKRNHGHCNVPQRWDKNPVLANWIANQRQLKRKNRLKSDY